MQRAVDWETEPGEGLVRRQGPGGPCREAENPPSPCVTVYPASTPFIERKCRPQGTPGLGGRRAFCGNQRSTHQHAEGSEEEVGERWPGENQHRASQGQGSREPRSPAGASGGQGTRREKYKYKKNHATLLVACSLRGQSQLCCNYKE